MHARKTKNPPSKGGSLSLESVDHFGLEYPKQLTAYEKNIIRQYMQHPQHQFYNRSQVYWKMRNDKALMINLKTFHTYCNELGLKRLSRVKQLLEP